MGQAQSPKNKSQYASKIDHLAARWKKAPFQQYLVHLQARKSLHPNQPKHEGKYDLRRINLRKIELRDAVVNDSCLSMVNGYQLKLMGCELKNNYIKKGDFEGALFEKVDFYQSTLSQCSFKEATFSEVSLTGGIFENCDFSGARFGKVDVADCIFDNSRFEGLQSPESIEFIGLPLSVKQVIFPAEILARMKDSPFKTAVMAQQE